MGKPFGIVDVLVTGEAAVDRLSKQAEQLVLCVPAAPAIGEYRCRHRGQAERTVQLTVGEQASIGGDARAGEVELDPAVEGDPQGRFLLRGLSNGAEASSPLAKPCPRFSPGRRQPRIGASLTMSSLTISSASASIHSPLSSWTT